MNTPSYTECMNPDDDPECVGRAKPYRWRGKALCRRCFPAVHEADMKAEKGTAT